MNNELIQYAKYLLNIYTNINPNHPNESLYYDIINFYDGYIDKIKYLYELKNEIVYFANSKNINIYIESYDIFIRKYKILKIISIL